MKRSWIGVMLAVSSLCGLFGAFGHPAAGIVVTANGKVFFIHTGQGVCKIDAGGKLTYIHKVQGGGHFLALDWSGKFSNQLPRLFEKLLIDGKKPTLLYASGGAPFVVSRDGNLYYGSGYPDGEDMTPGFHTLTRLSPDGKRTLFAPDLKKILADLNEGVMGLAASFGAATRLRKTVRGCIRWDDVHLRRPQVSSAGRGEVVAVGSGLPLPGQT